MKKFAVLVAGLMLSGCMGYSAKDGEATGQAKKVTNATPLICPDYYLLDVSLGVMRNGVGSMSTQDMWFAVQNVADISKMKEAVEKGSIVKVHYDTMRLTLCYNTDHVVTSFEIIK